MTMNMYISGIKGRDLGLLTIGSVIARMNLATIYMTLPAVS